MERIVLEVENNTAKRWQKASNQLKQQAVEAMKRALGVITADGVGIEPPKRKPTAEDIKSFYGKFQVDMSGYTFNRDEANER